MFFYQRRHVYVAAHLVFQFRDGFVHQFYVLVGAECGKEKVENAPPERKECGHEVADREENAEVKAYKVGVDKYSEGRIAEVGRYLQCVNASESFFHGSSVYRLFRSLCLELRQERFVPSEFADGFHTLFYVF